MAKNIKKLAKALGARIITDPEEIKEFEKKYGLPSVFVPSVKTPKKRKKK